MQRLLVIGPCGAGKSTVSGRLGEMLSVPVFHLDRLHWKAGWIEGSKEELRKDLEPIIAQERWRIDGNYGSTMDIRIDRADAIINLDYPIPLCFWRALKRVWKFRGRTRPDMTEGCPERFDFDFFLYIAMWNWNARPKTERLLTGHEDKVHRFKNPAALDRWLTTLEESA
jgi:adenylate kinase family enzyme